MIITRLMGGLGNQMFQYAAGRALAWRHRTVVKLDVTWFEVQGPDREAHSRFALDCFRFAPLVATADEIAQARGRKLTRTERWALQIARRLRLPTLVALLDRPGHIFSETRVAPFRPEFAVLPNHTYLEGMWQSPRYFADIADALRDDLELRAPPQGRNVELLATIASEPDATAIHVRRGDYARSQLAINGVCPPEYYRAAVARVLERVPCPRWFVFSDEPDAARALLGWLNDATFVTHNSGPTAAVEDIRLMRACRHHVIANSTFGWWGAWLAAHSGQVVVAPTQWFQGPEHDAADLLPGEWLRV